MIVAQALAQGFADLAVADYYKQAAQDNLEQWLSEARFEIYRPQLEWLVRERQWSLLLDSFYRMLPFGTGGRRGPVGIGINRFNPWTLALSVQGHIAYLQERYAGRELSVVIAYDVRIYNDLRGLYNPDLPSPLMGLTSRDFARVAAGVYTANGVRVWMLPEDTTTYLSTPELSFAIRYLQAEAGLNISASHNHPDDNGGKFYNDQGGQEVPPHDEAMVRQVERVEQVEMPDFAAAKSTGLVSWIDPEIHRAYIALNIEQSLAPTQRTAHIVFTPLHGTSDTTVGEVLQEAGFEVDVVPEQATHDGTFPAVPYRAPNPEVRESMEMGMHLAQEVGADVVMACDPDADRIGICSRTARGYQFLTGNEIAVILTQYKLDQLQRLGRLPAHPVVIKTEVTTELLRPITEQCGGTLIGDLLVGFKYHGNVLAQFDQQGVFQQGHLPPVQAHLDDFIIGVEESHGILVTSEIRDKDAAGAALLLAELAALQRQQNATLCDYLDDIYRRYGYYANLLTSMVMTGAEGLANIQKIQDVLRQQPPQRVADWRVTEVVDHWDEAGLHGAFLSETDRASRNVLAYRLENGARVMIRPSGTEPKNKVYIEVPSVPLGAAATQEALTRQKAETNAIAQQLADDFTRQMLAIIDVHLPTYALRVSGLVALDKRIEFVERFIPGLEERIRSQVYDGTTQEEVSQWIDVQLASYGKDARGLVFDAMEAYLEAESHKVEQNGPVGPAWKDERLKELAAMEAAFFFSPSA
jgi:phosphoglucomutase/phosphomannomutase